MRVITMKMIDKYLEVKEQYKYSIIIIKSGIFYVSFNEDAKILSYLFNYKVKDNSDYLIVGFPEKVLDKIINKFEESNLSYITIKMNETYVSKRNDLTQNKYERLMEKSTNIYLIENRIKEILGKLEKLKGTSNIINILDEIENII